MNSDRWFIAGIVAGASLVLATVIPGQIASVALLVFTVTIAFYVMRPSRNDRSPGFAKNGKERQSTRMRQETDE